MQRGHVHVERILLDRPGDGVVRPQRGDECGDLGDGGGAHIRAFGDEALELRALLIRREEHDWATAQQRQRR